MKKLTTEEIVKNFIEVHGNKYNYSHVQYKTAKDKVIIICSEHGEFEQLPQHHTKGSGCRLCANKLINVNNGKGFSQEKFIKTIVAKNIPNLSYDKVVYKSKREKVIVTCSVHGDYETTAEVLLKGNGCRLCTQRGTWNKKEESQFIKDSIQKHGDTYEYSSVVYSGCFMKVTIFCKKHNSYFLQTPSTHLKGSGCPLCNTSKGELIVMNYLKENLITFTTQKTFEGLVLRRKLKFDFYLPQYNACIEFDGEQHFRSLSKHWGGDEGFIKRQLADRMKNDFCELYNIPLLRIKFDNPDIEETIKNFLLNLETT